MEGRAINTLILKRRCYLYFSGSLRDALAHLVGRGGVEVDKGEAVVGGAGSCLRELLVIRLSAVFSLRRNKLPPQFKAIRVAAPRSTPK
jgi:hypothetical protein